MSMINKIREYRRSAIGSGHIPQEYRLTSQELMDLDMELDNWYERNVIQRKLDAERLGVALPEPEKRPAVQFGDMMFGMRLVEK